MQTRRGFTLIELLIVIGIVAVLAVTVILTLNPAELLKQARDSNRLADLNTLNKSLSIVETEVANASFGTSTILYVSIPDSSTTCANLGLPTLPAGYSYGCAPTSTLRNTNGTGWIPVNFGLISSGSPLSALPVDPTNTTSTGRYYTYIPGGSWELTALTESTKYAAIATRDGGVDPAMLEVGSDAGLDLAPFAHGLVGYWNFDEGSGASVTDGSGFNHPGTLINGPTWDTGANCKTGGCLSFDGINDYVQASNVGAFNHGSGHTLMVWRKTSGASGIALSLSFPRLGNNNPEYGVNVSGTARVLYGGGLGTGWQMIAGTYDRNTLNLYVDGALVTTANYPGIDTFSSNTLTIGAGYNYYIGHLDEARIYSRALSAAEIAAIYNATR